MNNVKEVPMIIKFLVSLRSPPADGYSIKRNNLYEFILEIQEPAVEQDDDGFQYNSLDRLEFLIPGIP